MNYYAFVAASDADLMALNDPQARADIQCTVALNSLGELSSLMSVLGAGLSLNLSVNVEGIKEIWCIADELRCPEKDDFQAVYEQWLATSKRADNAKEKAWFQDFLGFLPAFNRATHSLILLEPKLANPLSSELSVKVN